MLINNVLRAHLNQTVIVYLNDILIYSETEEEHVKHVQETIVCLVKFRLKLKLKKCEFHKMWVTFLSYIIITEEIEMNSEKIKFITEWSVSQTVKKVQEFLDFTNFNWQFIKKYSHKAISLTIITKKDWSFQWELKQQWVFEQLKKVCSNLSVLILFWANEVTKIETDASDLAIRVCIYQKRNDKWHLIAYYFRKMSDAEQRYDIHNKELLVIVKALKHWRIYTESCSELTIYTDHKNLVQFTTFKKLIKRQINWAEQLRQYKFTIVYTSEKNNEWADTLSQRSDLMNEKVETVASILKQQSDRTLISVQSLHVIMHIADNDFITKLVSESKDVSKEYNKNERNLIVKEDKIFILKIMK